MRPCGVYIVRVPRKIVRHLLPERTTSLAGLSAQGRFQSDFFFSRDATLSSFFDRREETAERLDEGGKN